MFIQYSALWEVTKLLTAGSLILSSSGVIWMKISFIQVYRNMLLSSALHENQMLQENTMPKHTSFCFVFKGCCFHNPQLVHPRGEVQQVNGCRGGIWPWGTAQVWQLLGPHTSGRHPCTNGLTRHIFLYLYGMQTATPTGLEIFQISIIYPKPKFARKHSLKLIYPMKLPNWNQLSSAPAFNH